MADLEAIKRKVRGLKAVAAANSGAFPAERATAARLATRLERELTVAPAKAAAPIRRSITLTFVFEAP